MSEVLLHIATLIASFFQAVTGIGFGMVAGPVVLVVLNDPAAVVISTLMSWLIALILFPFLRRGTDLALMGRLLAGVVLGLPLGLWLLSLSDVATLKLLAGAVIAILLCLMVFGAPGMRTPGWAGDLTFGALAGLFGGCLAMPGPTAALRITGLGHDKATVRATMVSFFCCAWPLVFSGQAFAIGITKATLGNAAMLVPATLAGLAIGNYAAARVSEAVFRRLVLGFLALTAVALLGDAALGSIGDGQ